VRAVSTIAFISSAILLVETAGDVAQHPAGGGELDDVGARRNLPPHRPSAIVRPVAGIVRVPHPDFRQVAVEPVDVAMAAGDGNAPSRRDDGGSGELPRLDDVAQGRDHARLVAEVPDGRESGQQRLPGVDQGSEGFVLIVALRRLQPGLEPVVQAAQVDVHVDEARHHRAVAKVDRSGPGHLDIAVPYFHDPAAADDDARLPPGRLTRHRYQDARVDDGDGLRGLRGRCHGRRGLGQGGSGQGQSERGQRGAYNLHRHPLDFDTHKSGKAGPLQERSPSSRRKPEPLGEKSRRVAPRSRLSPG
jgi:hypothetical protein